MMNPNDIMFLIIPATLVTLKLSLLALAAVLITKSLFKSPQVAKVLMVPMQVPAYKRYTSA